jgi:hypothetical protein
MYLLPHDLIQERDVSIGHEASDFLQLDCGLLGIVVPHEVVHHDPQLLHDGHSTLCKHGVLPQRKLILALEATPVSSIRDLTWIFLEFHGLTTFSAWSLSRYQLFLYTEMETGPKMFGYFGDG